MYIREWQRTVLLFALLGIAIGFLVWTQDQYSSNFVESFGSGSEQSDDATQEQ